MKIGVIGAGTMGQGIAKAFAQVEGNTVALCDIKQEWAENGLAKIKKCWKRRRTRAYRSYPARRRWSA